MRYKKDSNNSKEELNKTSLNIAYAMLKWNGFGFPQFDIQNSPNKSNNKLLFAFIEIYRNGIMHTFFPKDFSISNKKENDKLNFIINILTQYFSYNITKS
jgi:hypothetical protein